MSATCKEIPELVVGEIALLNMDFASKLGSLTISGTPTVTITPSGELSSSTVTTSGTKVQALYNAASAVSGKVYTVTIQLDSSGSPTQTFKGVGEIRICN